MNLKKRLNDGKIIVAPGVADTLGALLAERAGFELAFLSGSAMAVNHLGAPDIGLMSMIEVSDIMRRVRERTDIAVVVDADSGYGNAYQVARTVRAFELAGASAIQLEDMVNDKHPSEVQRRPLIGIADMQAKLKAALDARHNESLLISARTDAAVSADLDDVLERIEAYIETGVDMVFAEGLNNSTDRETVCAAVNGRVPILYNTLWQAAPPPTIEQLEKEGFAIALAPAAIVGAVVPAVTAALAELAQNSPHIKATQTTLPTSTAAAIDADGYLERYKHWRT